MSLTLLNIGRPAISASNPVSISDVSAMQDLFMSFPSKSGELVTPEKARRCSAVLACMRGISEDLSSLPLVLYRRGKNGDERAVDHPLYPLLLSAPNEVMTSLELREHIIFDLMLHGNHYVLRYEDSEGVTTSLWPLSAGYVTRRALDLVWTFTDPLTNTSGEFTSDVVWRGTIMSTNGIDGTALVLLAREAIGLLLAAEKQGARLFSHGVQTDFVLEHTEEVDEPTQNQLRDAFMRRYAGANNAWLPIILQGGLTAKKFGLTAQESQYIEARQFQIEDIARMWRYPEVLLGAGSKGKSPTYASAEQFFQAYVKHTLTPWAVRMEQTAERDLLSPSERKKYYIRHDFDQLLRGDTAARYAGYEKAIQSGILSPEEARKREGFPYVPGLNYYLMPSNFVQVAGQDAAQQEPDADEAGNDALARRVANVILTKERKGLARPEAKPEVFYAHYSGFVEDLTGADLDSVLAYLEMRRTTADRFSPEATEKAISALISLCKKDK